MENSTNNGSYLYIIKEDKVEIIINDKANEVIE